MRYVCIMSLALPEGRTVRPSGAAATARAGTNKSTDSETNNARNMATPLCNECVVELRPAV